METEFVAFSVLIIEHLLIKVNDFLNYKIFLAFYTIIIFTNFKGNAVTALPFVF
jgi:hypothetical protein